MNIYGREVTWPPAEISTEDLWRWKQQQEEERQRQALLGSLPFMGNLVNWQRPEDRLASWAQDYQDQYGVSPPWAARGFTNLSDFAPQRLFFDEDEARRKDKAGSGLMS